MERTLGSAKVGSTVTVIKIEGDGAYKRRIMDMGITKGSRIYIRKVRKEDAKCVLVETV